ncbi:unnamed protein product [Lactuca saligna]|uniref:BED-type domain-containing protein n=1 Tax=Lactuca saligna TaxID=75948 RepID=A0AA35VPA0_LACSI|nr:unnamed protein product [Lactuca saligna]
MENSPIDIDMDGASEVVEQNKMSVVREKRTSNAWRNYTNVRDPKTGKVVKAQCKHCSKLLTVTTKNGTSSLSKHNAICLQNPRNIDLKQKKISTFRTSKSDVTTVSNREFNQNTIRLVVAKMIVIDEQPFSYVERDGFRYFCSVVVPQFCIPSRFTVARDVSKLFLSETEQLRNTLKNLNCRIALTTDCWTSVQNISYMCLTAHFIDDNWKLHKRILNFQNIDSHKGKEIGKEIESCILYWGIEEKLSCITIDNASANDVAVAHITDNLTYKLVLGALVSLDVPTRWNATYIILETALKFERAFKRMRQEDPAFEKELKDGFPSQKDWENARNLSLCLKQFFEATKRMSGTLYVTANMHYHEILGVLASL